MSNEYMEILDTKSFVLRHIHPTLLRNGKISHKAFKPRTKDEGMLSVYSSSKIELKDGYRTHKYILKRPSDGMVALVVGVVNDSNLKAYHQPLELEESQVGHAEINKILELNEAHAFVDFREKSVIDVESLATILAKSANESHLHNYEETELASTTTGPIESSPVVQ